MRLPEAEKLQKLIKDRLSQQGRLTLAIDGPCGAGKSTLAQNLHRLFPDSLLIHMDDFFLQAHQRSLERLYEPGGNLDRERLVLEVLRPLQKHLPFSYRRYDCQTHTFTQIQASPAPLVLLEGVYSHHPAFAPFVDVRVFVDAPLITRLERLKNRVGEARLSRFTSEWIPLEDRYFDAFSIRQQADLNING